MQPVFFIALIHAVRVDAIGNAHLPRTHRLPNIQHPHQYIAG